MCKVVCIYYYTTVEHRVCVHVLSLIQHVGVYLLVKILV